VEKDRSYNSRDKMGPGDDPMLLRTGKSRSNEAPSRDSCDERLKTNLSKRGSPLNSICKLT